MPYADPERQRKAQRESYERQRAIYRQRNSEVRARNRAWLDEQKGRPCEDCGGEFPPYVMDYHHRDPETKEKNVSWLLINASRQRVIDEIAKCVLVCANCHRIREHSRA